MRKIGFDVNEQFNAVLSYEYQNILVLQSILAAFELRDSNSLDQSNLANIASRFQDPAMDDVASVLNGDLSLEDLSDEAISKSLTFLEGAIINLRERVQMGSLISKISSNEDVDSSVIAFQRDFENQINSLKDISKGYELSGDLTIAKLVNSKVILERQLMENVSNKIQRTLSDNNNSMASVKLNYIVEHSNYALPNVDKIGTKYDVNTGNNQSLMYKIGKGFYDTIANIGANIVNAIQYLNSNLNSTNIANSITVATNTLSEGISFVASLSNSAIKKVSDALSNYSINKNYNINAISTPLVEIYLSTIAYSSSIPEWNNFIDFLTKSEQFGFPHSNLVIPFGTDNYNYRAMITDNSHLGYAKLIIMAEVPSDGINLNSDAEVEDYLIKAFNELRTTVGFTSFSNEGKISGLSSDMFRVKEEISRATEVVGDFKNSDKTNPFSNYLYIGGEVRPDLGVIPRSGSKEKTEPGETDIFDKFEDKLIDPLYQGFKDTYEVVDSIYNGVISFTADRVIDLLSGIDSSALIVGNGSDVGQYLSGYFQGLVTDKQSLASKVIEYLFYTNDVCAVNGLSSNFMPLDNPIFSMRMKSVVENYEALGMVVSSISVAAVGAFVGIKHPKLMRKGVDLALNVYTNKRNRDKIVDDVIEGVAALSLASVPNPDPEFTKLQKVQYIRPKINKL